jgi:hypothetical protein
MSAVHLLKALAALPLLCAAGLVGGCNLGGDSAKAQQAQADTAPRYLCVADEGVVGTRTGLRAQQFHGPGPKLRLVSWQSADWELPADKTEAQLPGEGPRLAVKIAWRVSVVNDQAESTLESLKVRLREVHPEDMAAGHSWEIIAGDGEVAQLPVDPEAPAHVREASFAAEGVGTDQLPGLIAESLGGVNGGRFTVRLLDADGFIIADRDIRPLRGYEFKEQALKALATLDQRLAAPQQCLRVTAQDPDATSAG